MRTYSLKGTCNDLFTPKTFLLIKKKIIRVIITISWKAGMTRILTIVPDISFNRRFKKQFRSPEAIQHPTSTSQLVGLHVENNLRRRRSRCKIFTRWLLQQLRSLLISHQLIMHLSAFTTKRMRKRLLIAFYDEFVQSFMDIYQPVWW